MTKEKLPITETIDANIDLLRSVLIMNISRMLIDKIIERGTQLPESMNSNIPKQTLESMDRYAREVKRAIGKTNTYLDKLPRWEKVIDTVTVFDLLNRIGMEERDDKYEEFFGILVDCIDTVFYAQKHRKNLNFGKFKALFKLFTEEVRSDVNHESGVIQYFKGELYFKSVPAHEPEIKEQ